MLPSLLCVHILLLLPVEVAQPASSFGAEGTMGRGWIADAQPGWVMILALVMT